MNRGAPQYAAALRFLNRDPHANRELLLSLCYEVVSALHVVFRGDQPMGVLVRGPGPFNPDPDWIRLDALDSAAVDELWNAVHVTARDVISIHRPWIAAHLTVQHELRRTGSGVYGFILQREQLLTYEHPGARRLTRDDQALVERSNCGWSRSYFAHLHSDGRQAWAIVQDGQIVCRASSGYPYGDSEEVVGVWTHPQWRGRGLARMLVSYVAAAILERTPYAVYTTTYDNSASQAVARAVGFQLAFAADSYERSAASRSSLAQ